MDQIPAAPAKVSFQDGLLSISAQNSTLGEILREVRKLTGASIDIPSGGGAGERVVTQIGPGTPRDVLTKLLNGSSYNYVMVGSISDPGSVATVVLSSKVPGGPGETPSVANAFPNAPGGMPPRPGFNQPQMIAQQAANVQPAAMEEEPKEEDADATDDNAADQAQPVQPDAAQEAAQPDPNQPNSGPKTPEQILEMLRHPQPGPGGAQPQPPPQQ